MNIDKELIARLYHGMLLIRRVEEKVAEVYHTDVVKSPVHLSIGQESVAVGVCDALQEGDIVSNTYRCHATFLAKGGDVKRMMAELYGKKDGCAGGKAGSMHLVEIEKGILGASAVVGTTIPVALGYALALKREAKKTGRQRVVVAFFGDGATEEGCFYESVNFAALHSLPVLFLCENNKLAIHAPLSKRWATSDICKRVSSFGFRTQKITDGDVFAIRDAVLKEVELIREGKGPGFLECMTYRWKEHVGPQEDLNEEYRDLSEYHYWKKNDQIDRLAAMLGAEAVVSIQRQVEESIADAVNFSEKSSFPGEQDLMRNVYAA